MLILYIIIYMFNVLVYLKMHRCGCDTRRWKGFTTVLCYRETLGIKEKSPKHSYFRVQTCFAR